MQRLCPAARETHILPELKPNSLLSVKQLADNGYTTIFHPNDRGVTVHDGNDVKLTFTNDAVLQGWRDEKGLWRIPLTDDGNNVNMQTIALNRPAPTEAVHNVYELPSTQNVVAYHHASLGFPTKATLLQAAKKGFLSTFPDLTPDTINKFFPESVETQKGHMRQSKQGVRSTKVKDEEFNPPPGIKKKDVYLRVFDATKRSMYTDQTGQFPIMSRKGNKYMMVAVELDGNYIDVEVMKQRTTAELIKAYRKIYQRWKDTSVISPNWHVLDNEAPEDFKRAIRENGNTVELVPPDMHRRNAAERAIQTWKGHYISILSGVADEFPIQEWDELIPGAVITLNLLRPANVAPNVSAYAYHHGQFDYNRNPLAPLGCALQFHNKPGKRKSWGEHSSDGFYVGPALEHYRCHRVWVKATRAIRVTDTVFFKHKYITQPTVTPADAIVKAYQDLLHAIQGISNTKGTAHLEALQRMTTIHSPPHTSKTPTLPTFKQVQVAHPRVEAEAGTNASAPRVQFNPIVDIVEFEPTIDEPGIIASSPKIARTSLNPPQPMDTNDSIASRVKARLRGQATPEPEPSSIAERVAQRRRELANPVLDEETGQMLQYRQLIRHPRFKEAWNISAANEFGRLAQGCGDRVKGTDTIFFIHKHEIPANRLKDVTYVSMVCQVRTEKDEPNRTRATMGGNNINFPDDVGTPTADLLLIKIFLNSVISTPGAKFANADISNFYLMTPLTRPEFARIKLADIPDEIIEQYELKDKATPDGWVYFRVEKGMYGLPQSGSLANELLEKRLNKEGYHQSKIVPGLWRHATRKLQFVLVVDDFGIKYLRREDLDHLISTLEKYYKVKVDMDGKEYVKINLDWDYKNGKVHLSMNPYREKALRQFDNLIPSKKQDSPHPHVPPKYGNTEQFAEYDTSPEVGPAEAKYVQKVNGKWLWYGRAVDGTLLTALSALAAQQSKPTETTMKRVKQLLDFIATQEPAVLTYRKSDMILAGHSDAGYLNESNARSRAGGHHFLSENVQHPPNNGAILNVAEIIRAVMSSAAEAELGALYINARKAVEIRTILAEMGHPQPPTPMQTDNSTAEGIINSKVQPKRTKAMDMRFHWLRDRGVNQRQFRFYWRPGPYNYADYWTKHHPASHHRNMRAEFLTSFAKIMELRKCTST